MEISPATCYENLKRYWRRRRRRYQRRTGATTNKRKLRVVRLGGVNHRKIRLIPKLRLKIFSPIKLLAKFHDAYVDMMIAFACNVGKINKVWALGDERIAKSSQVLMVSTTCEEVDSRMVLEIYKRLAASPQFSA
ncbi:hypothetical protein CK203_011727 [Vitis vinifera]|uniref:Uncharacterized protein n=1 Tax=Vitis vinifera TaxID=29760 RepID=A0A438JUS4_VITVI|nr:hypothetical protein CK203_011727 [Vitis vinifera]